MRICEELRRGRHFKGPEPDPYEVLDEENPAFASISLRYSDGVWDRNSVFTVLKGYVHRQ